MPILTLMPGGEAPGAQSQYTPDCPNWILVVVHDQEIAIESWCGRYFEYIDNYTDDIAELITDADFSEILDGLYVVEGHVAPSYNGNEGATTEWHFDLIRALKPAEWQCYREGIEIWDLAYFDPAFVEHVVDEAANELHALLDAGKGWLAWRRNIEIDLSEAEIQLVAAVHALMDEGDGLPNVSR